MASKRHVRYLSCGDKMAYTSESAAKEAARQLGRKGKAWLSPYRCRFCRRWHVGHMPHEARRRIAV
jgi:hypothetical protein